MQIFSNKTGGRRTEREEGRLVDKDNIYMSLPVSQTSDMMSDVCFVVPKAFVLTDGYVITCFDEQRYSRGYMYNCTHLSSFLSTISNTHNRLKIKWAYDYLSIFKDIKNTVLRHGFILSIWLKWFQGKALAVCLDKRSVTG